MEQSFEGVCLDSHLDRAGVFLLRRVLLDDGAIVVVNDPCMDQSYYGIRVRCCPRTRLGLDFWAVTAA